MNEKGLPRDTVLAELENSLAKDMDYRTGRILGSMCTMPHDFAVQVYTQYVEKNLGDRGLFPGSAEIEEDLIRELGELFGDPTISGSIVSGGSEANIIACRLIRQINKNVKKPVIFTSDSAHVSFDKSAQLMGIHIKRIPLTEHFLPDLSYLRDNIDQNTVGIVGIAGTTSLGLIEPLSEMAEIAEAHDLFFHVDAAFGGFVIPFLPNPAPLFDFRIPAVCSLTADPHKQGMNVIPSGGFFFRDPSILEDHGFNIPYLAGGKFNHLSLIGTRPGAAVISFWALIRHLGKEGYRKIIKECMDNAYYLLKRLDEIPQLKLAAPIEMNVVGIQSADPSMNMKEVEQKLREKGWALGYFSDLDLIRVVCMPHIQKYHIDEFCDTLENILKEK